MRVFGLGEIVYDIIFKNGIPVGAKPGGSVLNTIVSLARMGIETHFISELGDDDVANVILSFLKDNSVSTECIHKYLGVRSALALAFLNENNDASYTFYKDYPIERLGVRSIDFKDDDILIFGSSYAIDKDIRQQVNDLVAKAKDAGVTIIYDPNFRNKDGVDREQRIDFVKQNIQSADIIRGSDEDFFNLFNLNDAKSVFDQVLSADKILIYTQNADGIDVVTSVFNKHFDVDNINPISTIGAGDNFNAGVIYSIVKLSIAKDGLLQLTSKQFDVIINNAKQFSTTVCLSMDNYIPKDFALS